jgi:hypothetical protein
MGLVGVGFDVGLADRLPKDPGRLVDRGVMHGAARRVRDAVAAGLEESDLGTPRASSNRESGAMPMPFAGQLMDRGPLETGRVCDFARDSQGVLGGARFAESGASRTGRAMGTDG